MTGKKKTFKQTPPGKPGGVYLFWAKRNERRKKMYGRLDKNPD